MVSYRPNDKCYTRTDCYGGGPKYSLGDLHASTVIWDNQTKVFVYLYVTFRNADNHLKRRSIQKHL